MASWRAVRADPDIQFAPVKYTPKEPRETPGWIKWLSDFFESLFEPLGRKLGMSWPVLSKVLIALAVVAILVVLWRTMRPLVGAERQALEPIPEWTPERTAALALLEDADRLAAAGQFEEAVHLLLRRSVHQIAEARPDWLAPSSTAREIAALPGLGPRAREAFALIVGRVERGFYALIRLDADDWQVARAAYADFALAEIAR